MRNDAPDWQRANPIAIARSLQHALAKPSGGWFVLDATQTLWPHSHPPVGRPSRIQNNKPMRYVVDGHELVAFVDPIASTLSVAPAACPHMGAHLADGHVDANGCLVCPWHGLALPSASRPRVSGQGTWSPMRTFDDGVLTWVQFNPDADDATDAPIITKRPDRFLEGVIRREGTCEPRDVIANRLDPWHGVHFHPYAFASLEVLENSDDHLDLRVGYRVTPKHIMLVQARFDCPDPRTIVMTITDGEGVGSVVETHATPLIHAGPGRSPRTAIIEATLATSDRSGFTHALKGAAIARPIIRFFANRLWRDDIRYAERTWQLRNSADE